jgi:hypothetical protein
MLFIAQHSELQSIIIVLICLLCNKKAPIFGAFCFLQTVKCLISKQLYFSLNLEHNIFRL